MNRFVAFVLILLNAMPLLAADYVLRDGYYYDSAGARYTRSVSQVWVPGYYYYSNCCKYWKAGYYKDVYTYHAYPLTSAEPDWRLKLLEIAATRDKLEGKLRYQANEHNMFVESVRELGLSGNFFWHQYGMAPQLAAPNAHLGIYGASGNTVYSQYANSSVADVYGAVDTNVLFQQAAALAKDGLSIGGQATERFAGLIDKERDRAVFAAEIIARGQAAAQALQAASPTPSTHIRQSQTQTTITQLGPKRLAAVRACIQCHGDGANNKTQYRVLQHWTLPQDLQREVVDKLLADPSSKEFMPKNGKRLAADLILEFMPQDDRARVQSQ